MSASSEGSSMAFRVPSQKHVTHPFPLNRWNDSEAESDVSDTHLCVFGCDCGELLMTTSCRRVGDAYRLSCAGCGRTYRIHLTGLDAWRVTQPAA